MWSPPPVLLTLAEASPGGSGSGLALVDWVILVLYAGGTIFLGWWFGRRQSSTREYFIGSGKMNPMLIGVSLFATLLSTISYRSMPGESLGKGPVYFANYLAYPFIFLIVGYVLLPVYMRQRVTSAYELLESRLGLSVRLLGAVMFLVLRLVWMSLLIYLTADALRIMMGVEPKWIPLIVLITSTIAIIYTSLGGLRAVVITDLIQTLLLYGGAVLVLVTITVKMGGFGWFPTEWQPNWDRQPVFPESLSTRVSVLGSILMVLCWYVATSGGDQVSVQRFMATKDAKAARRAIGMQLIVGAVVGLTLGLVGFALLGYFQQFPAELRGDLSIEENADAIFPFYIAGHLPPVVSGLVLSGLFAAAMSSVDSGVNSITAVISKDFIGRLSRRKHEGGRHDVRTARILAVAIGIVVVIGGTLFSQLENPDNITALTGKTVNLLTVPIFCLFLFALFDSKATPLGVWAGWVVGTTVAALIAFSGPIFGFIETPDGGKMDPISFQWIAPAALVADLGVGLLVSRLFPQFRRPTSSQTT